MSFPKSVEERALVACGRCCCICHKFCGTKIELHHIKQRAYDGEDTFENCIPLCFDCHADMGKADPNHARGKRYSESELKHHRDSWYKQRSTINLPSQQNTRIKHEHAITDRNIKKYLRKKWFEAAVDEKLKERMK